MDLVTTPGGAIVGVNFADDLISIAIPNDRDISRMVAYDISRWRASASGGDEFVIGGKNFGNLDDTSVTIGGESADITSVSNNRIVGTLPAFSNTTDFLDVTVASDGETSTIEAAFLPLAS